MRRIRDVVASRQCAVCSCKNSEHEWNFAGHLTEDVSCLQEYFDLERNCEHHSWVCKHCVLCFSNAEQLATRVSKDINSPNPVLAKRAELIEKALVTVRNNGCVYVPQLTSQFKTFLIEQGRTFNEISKSCKAFSKYLDVLCTKAGFSAFCKSSKLGKIIFNDQVFSDKAVEHVYNLHVQHWKLECRNNDLESTYISPNRLQIMIKDRQWL